MAGMTDLMVQNFQQIPIGTPTPDNKMKIIKALRWFDTIHDFFPVNDKNPRGENIRDILSRRFKTGSGEDFSVAMASTKQMNITPSDVEKQTEKFYHQFFNTTNIGDHVIDVKTITDKYIENGEIKSAEILQGVGVPPYTKEGDLQLTLSKDRGVFKKEPKATNFLANVILTFFFGEDINRDVYFLIDAQAGRMDCMFQDIDQINTLVNVLTIGDSAVTNPNDVTKTKKEDKQDCGVDDQVNKFKRKVYLADPYTIPYNSPNGLEKKYKITSNEFTEGLFEMWYQDADLKFTKQNNASARLYVKKKGTEPQPVWFSEFTLLKKSPNSGASVGTLKQLINAVDTINDRDATTRLKAKKDIFNFYKNVREFNLTPILHGMIDEGIPKDDIINFLYDYKRGGDHEQVNSANYLYNKGLNVILLTGDRLCSLYARLIGQPCIYIHSGEYDMYRFLREVTVAQDIEQHMNLITSRIAFIRTEVEKINPAVVVPEIEKLETKMEEYSDMYRAFGLENQLYSFVFDCLLSKIKRMREKCLQYEDAKTRLLAYIETINVGQQAATEGETLAYLQKLIADLNAEYNTFYTFYKELYNFALYYTVESPKNKFSSKALDYDDAIVGSILSYFTKYNEKTINLNLFTPGGRNESKRLGEKREFIEGKNEGLGEKPYYLLRKSFIHYLKKCISYRDGYVDEAEIDKIDNQAPIVRDIIKMIMEPNGIRISDEALKMQTIEVYKPILNEIQTFILTEINKLKDAGPSVAGPSAEPSAAGPSAEPSAGPSAGPSAMEMEERPLLEPSLVVPSLALPSVVGPSLVAPIVGPSAMELEGGGYEDVVFFEKEQKIYKEEQMELLNLMKISLYEWYANIPQIDLTGLAIKSKLIDIYTEKQKNIKFTMPIETLYTEREADFTILSPDTVEERKRRQRGEDIKIKNTIEEIQKISDVMEFTEVLKMRLIYEYYLFYGDTNYLTPDNPAQRETVADIFLIETEYIQPLLEDYYLNIKLTHFQEMADTYLSTTDDSESVKRERINQLYKNIHDLYPDNVYNFIYNGYVEAKSNPQFRTERPMAPAIINKSIWKEKEKTKKKKQFKPIFEKLTEEEKKQINTFVGSVMRKNKDNIIPEERAETKSIVKTLAETLLKKYKIRAKTPHKTSTIGNLAGKKHKKPSYVNKGRSVRGGKGTRKYKNKRNKKTRQQYRNTRKNKTLKIKRERGKKMTR